MTYDVIPSTPQLVPRSQGPVLPFLTEKWPPNPTLTPSTFKPFGMKTANLETDNWMWNHPVNFKRAFPGEVGCGFLGDSGPGLTYNHVCSFRGT